MHGTRKDVTQQQGEDYAGQRQLLTGLVQETQQYRAMSEECPTAQLAAGPEIDRFRRRKEELLREVQRHNDDGDKIYVSDRSGSSKIMQSQKKRCQTKSYP